MIGFRLIGDTMKTRMGDLEVGEKFVFRDKLFTKLNDDGWGFAFLNVKRADGSTAFLDPRIEVEVIH